MTETVSDDGGGAPASLNTQQKKPNGPDSTAHLTNGGKPRSRSGCLTCKAKHLKCDETKPECLVCIRKGWTCGGYQREFRWSYKHERKTKDGARSKGKGKSKPKAGGKNAPEQRRQSTSNPAGMTGVLDFTMGDMSLNMMAANSQLPGLSNALPMLPTVDYGWDINDATNVNPPQPTAGWEPQHSASNLIVPMLLDQSEVLDSELAEDIEMFPDPGTSLALATTIQNFEYSTQIPPAVNDLPSVLVTQWFKSVCSVWSAYDSEMNLNRQLATSLWSESESVLACLQSMSASFLATRIPYLKETSFTMMKSATKAIHTELSVAKKSTFSNTIPTGLLFSLFCMGTTLCWIEAGQLGIPFLRAAKSLLDQINNQQPVLRDQDNQLLDFFKKSWLYCDMLLSVVSYDYVQFPVNDDVVEGPSTPSDMTGANIVPHPWTGISTTSSTLFTRAIRLCRSFRHNVRKQVPSTSDIEMVLEQMEEAPKIEEQLLQLEYDTDLPLGETGDQQTPSTHLLKVAEAYRIAALLHLYQTFPDLVALRIPDGSSSSRRGPVPWEEWIIPLSLRLVDILEHIPAESGSRMVQPLLCITASTGLRLDIPANAWKSGSLQTQANITQDLPIGVHKESCDITEFMNQIDGVEQQPTEPPNMPTQLSIDVGNARAFVLKRLNVLENTLPPKPIIMAKNLVQAIWAAYDGEMPGCNSVHWVDVMEEQNLRSFFG